MYYFIVKQCCCKLETIVKTVGIFLSAVYVVSGLCGVGWFILNNVYQEEVTERPRLDSVIEVSDLSLEVSDLESTVLGSEPDIRRSLSILAGVLATTFVGLLTNLLLVVGVKTEQRLLLLPWLLYHVIFVLACLGGGLYLALHFTVLSDHEDYLKAVIALFPLVFGIFFIFIWIMVDQLFVNLRHKQHIEEVVASRRASLASVHTSALVHPQYNSDTIRSNISYHYNTDTIRSNHSNKSGRSSKSVRSVKSVKSVKSTNTVKTVKSAKNARTLRAIKRDQHRSHGRAGGRSYQIKEFSCKLDIPKIRRSHSFDQILDSSTSSSSSGGPSGSGGYWTSQEVSRTLPRKLKMRHGMEQESLDWRERGQYTDTMRSTRSLASTKSVSIHPEVTEYHYQQTQESIHPDSTEFLHYQQTQEIHPEATDYSYKQTQDVLENYKVYPSAVSANVTDYPRFASLPRPKRETLEVSSLPRPKRETMEASVNFGEDNDVRRWREGARGVSEGVTEFNKPVKGAESDERKISVQSVHNIPPPVYPTLPLNKDWKTKLSPRSKGLTKDQIIGFYCQASGDIAL